MARQSSTWVQLSAHRFATRRMEHALVRSDVGMHDDPLRAQSVSLMAGAVVAVIVVAACAVLAFIKPHGTLGSAQIVLARETGALYVRLGDTWHPAPNLASARLAAGAAADPVVVAQQVLADVRRGPAVGIPGAPATIGTPLPPQTWTVCDGPDTVVIAGDGPSSLLRLDPTRNALVTPRGESAAITYLLYAGQRAEVDLRNPAVVRALRLDGVAPLPVSRALLDSIPEVAPIAVPHIDGFSSTGPSTLGGARVGAVVRVSRTETAQAAEFYVVLADGVQRITEMAADLIRFAYPGGPDVPPTVAPAAIAATRTVDTLSLTTLPERAGAATSGLVCARWTPAPSGAPTNTAVLVGRALTVDAGVVLAQADGDGPAVDRVLIPTGHGAFVRSSRIVGDDGLTGPRFLVADSGVVYGVRDDAAATALGLSETSARAPWSILAWLPRGPELSVEGASRTHDVLDSAP